MKKGTILGTIVGAALLAAAPFSLQWSQKTVTLSLDSADARIGRPLTPMSVAGVHRRAYRWAAYGAAAYGVGSYYGASGYGSYGYPAYGYGSYASGYGYPAYGYGSYASRYGYGSYASGYPWVSVALRLRSRLWLWWLGRPPGGDPSRPLALRREPKLSRPRGSKMGRTAGCRQPLPCRNGVGIVMDRASLSTSCQCSRA